MKRLLVALLPLVPLVSHAGDDIGVVGDDWDGKCPVCKAEGKRSTVTAMSGPTCTMAYCGGGSWNEDGVYQIPRKCNTCSYSLRCSNGHEFTKIEKSY